MNWRNLFEWFGKTHRPSREQTQCAPSQLAVPADAQAEIVRGMLAARAGRHREAIADFEQALALAPELAIAHRELARARIELGELEAAADSLMLAGHFSPDDAGTHFLLGLAAQRRANCLVFWSSAMIDLPAEQLEEVRRIVGRTILPRPVAGDCFPRRENHGLVGGGRLLPQTPGCTFGVFRSEPWA